jgi:hypothetical protein
MPLRIISPPSGTDRVAARGLADVLQATPPDRGALGRASLETLALTAPHPVHTMTLDDATQTRLPAWEAVIRWRFLVEDGDRTVAAVEVRIDRDTGAPRLAQVEEGALVHGAATAIGIAEAAAEVDATMFELGLLRVPALSVEALWLRALNAADDRFMPLDPAPQRFESFRLYSVRTFLSLLKAEADEHPAFDSAPQVAVAVG